MAIIIFFKKSICRKSGKREEIGKGWGGQRRGFEWGCRGHIANGMSTGRGGKPRGRSSLIVSNSHVQGQSFCPMGAFTVAGILANWYLNLKAGEDP